MPLWHISKKRRGLATFNVSKSMRQKWPKRHNKAAVQIKEDMKKMVQLPMVKPRPTATLGKRVFGVPLLELRQLGLVEDGVPLVVRRMVEYLLEHGLQQEGLFRVNGSVRAVDALRQRLERCELVDLAQESDVCTVASLLKQFLRDLPEGLIHSSVQPAFIQQHQESSEESCCQHMRELLQQLPELHHSLLKYLCHFLTQVDQRHKENRMNALNLATVFGPNVFHVSLGFDGIQEQNICNKIMAKFIQSYSTIFESDTGKGDSVQETETANVIIVKEVQTMTSEREKSPYSPTPKARTPVPRKKKAMTSNTAESGIANASKEVSDIPSVTPRKKKVKTLKSEMAGQQRVLPQPALSAGLPHARPLPLPLTPDPCSSPRAISPALFAQDSGPGPQTPTFLQPKMQSQSPEAMELVSDRGGLSRSVETLSRPGAQVSQERQSPIKDQRILTKIEQHNTLQWEQT